MLDFSALGLAEAPFSLSPDPRFFYLAPSHAESVAKCEYAIRNKSGLAVVYGDVGTGKTTILNELRQRFGDGDFTIAVMNNPNQTSDTALLKAIAAEFGLDPPRTKQGAFDQFQEFLAREVAEGAWLHVAIDGYSKEGKRIKPRIVYELSQGAAAPAVDIRGNIYVLDNIGRRKQETIAQV
mgnify:CR=1 FL=1